MSMRQIIVLAVAAMAAIAALFLVRGMAAKPKQVEITSVAPGLPVLVAAKALEPGDATVPGDIVWVNFPPQAVSESFVQQASMPNATTDMVGAVARVSIAKGEPITTGKLVKPGEQGFMAAMLTPGYRAVAIPISAQTAAAGFILPNDKVDIIVTRSMPPAPGAQGEQIRSDVVLQDVRVLAIDQKFRTETAAPAPAIGGVATLELSPRDAETLAMAEKMGSVSLALRGIESEPDNLKVASARRHGARVLRQGLEETGQIKIHGFGVIQEVPVPSSQGGGR
jgi:pilus assembly protein CpaB